MFSYLGGKSKMLPQLYARFPVCRTFCDVFGGSAKVLLGTAPHELDVLNEIDPRLFALYDAVKNDSENLIHELQSRRYDKETFYRALKGNMPADTFTRYQMSKLGRGLYYNEYPTQREEDSKWLRAVGKIRLHSIRLRSVVLRNRSWERILDEYDATNTLFYLDPPYLKTAGRGTGYAYDFTTDDHITLCKRLNSVKSRVALSGYRNPLYEHYLTRWNAVEFTKWNSGLNNQRNPEYVATTETLWMNY